MLRMSLINVAVKSGPPSPCPFCCSVLVPLQCPQSQEQIETLMMDIQPHPPLRSSHNPSAGLGSPPSPSLAPWGRQSRGSQPVRQACSPHQFRESRRQPCILTSLALNVAQFRRLQKQRREASSGRGGSQLQRRCNDTTPGCRSAKVFTGLCRASGLSLQLRWRAFCCLSGGYTDAFTIKKTSCFLRPLGFVSKGQARNHIFSSIQVYSSSEKLQQPIMSHWMFN